MIRVVIADDHKIFREGVSLLLKDGEGIEVVGEAGNCKEAYDLICEKAPDVAILDVMMPDGSGIDVISAVRKTGLKTKIIMLTMQKDVATASRATKQGADGYILKDSAYEELRNVIEVVLADDTYLCPSIAVEMEEYKDAVLSKFSKLTLREKEILRFITAGQTSREIGEDLCISIKTVETHRTNVMRKLDLHRTADLVRYAIEHGLDKIASSFQ